MLYNTVYSPVHCKKYLKKYSAAGGVIFLECPKIKKHIPEKCGMCNFWYNGLLRVREGLCYC